MPSPNESGEEREKKVSEASEPSSRLPSAPVRESMISDDEPDKIVLSC
jgi:hypothetical protein